MTQAKHTPGPWIIDRNGDVNHHSYFVSDFPIAMVSGPLTDKAANARLIAAAPDLLEALIETSSSLRQCFECDEDAADAYGITEQLKKADSAIAKATGKE
jgi:hypothetical protein